MYCSVVLYTEPMRPLINPKFDLFAWLNNADEPNLLFPARVVTRVEVMLPDKSRINDLSDDLWKFVNWQTEEKGYTMVRSIDHDWMYWAMLADKYTLLEMAKVFTL